MSPAGTMYSGTRVATDAVTAAVSIVSPTAGTTYPTSSSPADGVRRTSTTAWSTDGSAVRAASISPSSMRSPRSLTWKSVRPR